MAEKVKYEVMGAGVNNNGWYVWRLKNLKTGKVIEKQRHEVAQLRREGRLVNLTTWRPV